MVRCRSGRKCVREWENGFIEDNMTREDDFACSNVEVTKFFVVGGVVKKDI